MKASRAASQRNDQMAAWSEAGSRRFRRNSDGSAVRRKRGREMSNDLGEDKERDALQSGGKSGPPFRGGQARMRKDVES